MGTVVATGNDLTATSYDSNSRALASNFLPVEGTGYVQAVPNGRIGLADGEGLDGENELNHAMWRNSDNGKIICFTQSGNVFFSDEISGRPDTTVCRLRADGSLIHYEYSLDGGATFPFVVKTATQESVALYIKATLAGGNVSDVKQFNLS